MKSINLPLDWKWTWGILFKNLQNRTGQILSCNNKQVKIPSAVHSDLWGHISYA